MTCSTRQIEMLIYGRYLDRKCRCRICLTDRNADANDLAPDVNETKGASRKWGATPGHSSVEETHQAGSEQIGDPQANEEYPDVPSPS